MFTRDLSDNPLVLCDRELISFYHLQTDKGAWGNTNTDKGATLIIVSCLSRGREYKVNTVIITWISVSWLANKKAKTYWKFAAMVSLVILLCSSEDRKETYRNKMYNARAQPMNCSLSLGPGNIPVPDTANIFLQQCYMCYNTSWKALLCVLPSVLQVKVTSCKKYSSSLQHGRKHVRQTLFNLC